MSNNTITIKYSMDVGLVGCSHDDYIKVNKEEWNAKTEEEKDLFLEELYRDLINNNVDFYYEVVGDDEDGGSAK